MYKKNAILLIGSDSIKKENILNKLKDIFAYSYLKLEAIFATITDLHADILPEAEYINFFNKFLDNISKKNHLYVIDINDCNPKNIIKLIGDNNVSLISLDTPLNIPNTIYIDITQSNIENQLEQLKKEVLN